MNNRRLLVAGLLCAALFVVTACGGRAPDSRGGVLPPTSPPTTTPGYGQDMPTQAPSSQNPSPSPANDEDGEFSILPAPSDGDGFGSDPLVAPFRPVDETFGNWTVTGADPVEVARQFVLGNEPCDCADSNAVLFEEIGDHAVVEVVLMGIMDDALQDRLYRVTLAKQNGVWTVAAAEYQDTCRRGVDDDGLCI